LLLTQLESESIDNHVSRGDETEFKLLAMNIEGLAKSLIQITSRLPEKDAEKIRQYISSTRVKTLGLMADKISSTNFVEDLASEKFRQGIIGGNPLLPTFFNWPDDRYGQPMIFLAQFDMAHLPAAHQWAPKDGLITIFRSAAAASLNSKDRKGFAVHYVKESDRKNALRASHPENNHLAAYGIKGGLTWTISKDLNALKTNLNLAFDLEKDLTEWISAFNALSRCPAQLFGNNVTSFRQLQETCAFAFNGISYNNARALDEHYSHLIVDAQEWLLLSRIDEQTLFGSRHPVSESLILIRQQDLQDGLFERAWIVVRAASKK